MKIVYVTSSLPFGSGEAFIIPEIEELRRQGHTLKIVPLWPRGRPLHAGVGEYLEAEVSQPLISSTILVGALREFLRNPFGAMRACGLVLTVSPRLLLKNLVAYLKGLWLAGIVRKWGAEHIHAHWVSTTASMAMVASEVSGVPWSASAHRWDVVENNLLIRKAKHACFIRCISRKTQQMVLRRGVPPQKTFVIHLGINIPGSADMEMEYSISDGERREFVVLSPASLIPVKGHKYLIEALARLPSNVHLWLAGEGELRGELESLVVRLGLSGRVRFLGALPRETLLDLYRERKVDAVALASVDLGGGLHEGIPFALVEAMAFGIPVVATATGGIPELLEKDSGLLVPERSSEALRDALLRLVEDADLRKRLGKQGRQRIEEEFAVSAIVRRLVWLWQEKGCKAE